MIYCKTDSNGKILEVLQGDEEFARANGFTEPCHRKIVQVYNGSYKFADEVTDADFQPTLDEVKAEKIAELKMLRDSKEVEDIQVNGYLYDYDEKARERINAAIIALDLTGGTITWTLADNTDKEVSSNDLRFVIAMVAQRSNVLHTQYRHLKEAVNAATTISEVDSISWSEK